ncbi:MAG: DUF2251 domain-containing protein [Bacteroidota bacterium]
MFSNKPTLLIYEEQLFNVGDDTFIDSVTDNGYAVAFEDDGETGYFYAIDNNNNQTILDALHVYDVASVTDKDKESTIKILWTTDYTKAFLSINNYYHALFDFENKAGYCRNAFPATKNSWAKIKERKLTDDLIDNLIK